MNWPLGINPDMDAHAASHGLAHWSCVDPEGNSMWVRRDGNTHHYETCLHTYRQELQQIDMDTPIREDFAKFEDPTIQLRGELAALSADRARLEREVSDLKQGVLGEWYEELNGLRLKIAYVNSMGLSFGIMKTSDKPEGFLAHIWEPWSDHERMFRDWTETFGKVRQVVKDCISICEKYSEKWQRGDAHATDAGKDSAREIANKYKEVLCDLQVQKK